MKKILTQSTIKTCELDPLPTSFLTHCLDDLLPHLTSIINDSLHSGLFPSAFKSAIVKPLLKKTTLNPEILKNYRPVSNLSFLSKILEKVVPRQLSNHLLTNNLFCSHQSVTVPVKAPRLPFSRSSMTFSLLSMKTKSLFCLCLNRLLPLIPLTTPFFCHVLVKCYI